MYCVYADLCDPSRERELPNYDGDENDDKNEEIYEQILDLLACYKVVEAVKLAKRAGLRRLSLLISQVSGDDMIKHLMWNQVLDWKAQGATSTIPTALLKIYLLLAGDLGLVDSTSNDNSSFGDYGKGPRESLLKRYTWFRSIGLLFWYGNGSTGKLSDAVKKYDRACEMKICDEPNGFDSRCPHVLYSLMKALLQQRRYVSSGSSTQTQSSKSIVLSVLDVYGWSTCSLDSRGPYLALVMLECLNLIDPYSSAAILVRQDMIFQLLCTRQYEWAVFVALQLPHSASRDKTVKDLVCMWSGYNGWECDTETKEQFLWSKLRVPESWIHQSAAWKCKYEHNTTGLVTYLNFAGLWRESGLLISRQLAPLLVFAGGSAVTKLKILLQEVYDHILIEERRSKGLDKSVLSSNPGSFGGRGSDGTVVVPVTACTLLMEYLNFKENIEDLTTRMSHGGNLNDHDEGPGHHRVEEGENRENLSSNDIVRELCSSAIRLLSLLLVVSTAENSPRQSYHEPFGSSQLKKALAESDRQRRRQPSLYFIMLCDIGTYLFKVLQDVKLKSKWFGLSVANYEEISSVIMSIENSKLDTVQDYVRSNYTNTD